MTGRAFPPVSVQARAWTPVVGSGDGDEATAGDGLSSGPAPGPPEPPSVRTTKKTTIATTPMPMAATIAGRRE